MNATDELHKAIREAAFWLPEDVKHLEPEDLEPGGSAEAVASDLFEALAAVTAEALGLTIVVPQPSEGAKQHTRTALLTVSRWLAKERQS